MILMFHVLVAVTSLVFSTFLYFYPSKSKINVASGLLILTIASGSYLIVSTKVNVLKTCLVGLVYLGASFYALAAAKNKLATEVKEINI